MPDFNTLKPEYSHMWAVCTINPGKKKAFDEAAALIKKGETTYRDLESKTGVPWYLIGMLHYRESDCDFHTHLHNGDSLRYRTHHVPAGRPPVGNPPFTFEYSAIDALKYEGFDKIHDWSIERVLYCLEQYNGWGYRTHGVPSAYVWAGTSDYHAGKFVSDGVFSAYVVDSQLGCAGILKVMLSGLSEEETPSHDDTGIDDTYKASGTLASLSGSRKWWWQNAQQVSAGTAAGAGLLAKGVDMAQIQSTKAMIDFLKQFAIEYGIYFVVGTLLAIVAVNYLMKKYMVQDVTSGRALPSGLADAPKSS